MSQPNEVSAIVYTDGACSGNPGPGGWAAIVVLPPVSHLDKGEIIELVGAESSTTNNRMEMLAALRALQFLAPKSLAVDVYTDSVYVIRGMTQWAFGWKRRGWKTAEGKEVLNRDLWQALMGEVGARDLPVKWHFCRGHQGTAGNERCDELAVKASQGFHPRTYRGSFLGYDYDVYPPPEHQPLPEMKAKENKPKAHSYLSYLSGTVMRHQDWSSCERRVKGQSGAKFKKAMSPEEENQILQAWGLNPERTKIQQ